MSPQKTYVTFLDVEIQGSPHVAALRGHMLRLWRRNHCWQRDQVKMHYKPPARPRNTSTMPERWGESNTIPRDGIDPFSCRATRIDYENGATDDPWKSPVGSQDPPSARTSYQCKMLEDIQLTKSSRIASVPGIPSYQFLDLQLADMEW